MKKYTCAAILGTAGLVAASALTFTTPAQAALTQCGNNVACAWVDGNFSGAFGAWSGSVSALGNYGFHDNITSQANYRTAYNGWFSDPGYSGNLFQTAPGGAGQFTWPDPRNDSFDSLYFY